MTGLHDVDRCEIDDCEDCEAAICQRCGYYKEPDQFDDDLCRRCRKKTDAEAGVDQ